VNDREVLLVNKVVLDSILHSLSRATPNFEFSEEQITDITIVIYDGIVATAKALHKLS